MQSCFSGKKNDAVPEDELMNQMPGIISKEQMPHIIYFYAWEWISSMQCTYINTAT